MFIVRHRKIFYTLSAILIALSIVAMFWPGFNLGIDFRGGTIIEVRYPDEYPNIEDVRGALQGFEIGSFVLQPTGEKGYTLRTRELSQDEKTSVMNALSLNHSIGIEEVRSNTIGPVIGRELRAKALIALAVVLLGIVLFVTFAFRKVSEPVPSWKYGLITVLSLAHDVIIPTGIYLLLAPYTGAEIDILFVSAILAILGYSVHDTIVVFDRVRENLRLNLEERQKRDFETTVADSIEETFGRSINTSVSTFLVLLVLYILGPESTRNFSLLLLLGIIVGAYSSIFFGSPLLITLERFQRKE